MTYKKEIERKFFITYADDSDEWKKLKESASSVEDIEQGYIYEDKNETETETETENESIVRICVSEKRKGESGAVLTIDPEHKASLTHEPWSWKIPLKDAEDMMGRVCGPIAEGLNGDEEERKKYGRLLLA